MPTGYTPIYRIMRDGLDITDKFNDRATQIRVDFSAGGGAGDTLQITLDDRDWQIARPVPDGMPLSVWLGYEEVGLAYMGQFKIETVRFRGMPRAILLIGSSTGFNDIKKTPQIINWNNKTVSDILTEIAGQAGIGVAIDPAVGSLTLPFKNQTQSNLAIIHELERITGSVAKIVDGKLLFAKRDSTQSVSGVAMPSLVLTPEHFGSWDVVYEVAPAFSAVKASWFDKIENVRKFVTESISDQGENGQTDMIGAIFNSEAEAKAAAKAKGEAYKRAECRAVFELAKGDPWIKDQQPLVVSGMRDGIDGSYSIDIASHTYVRGTGLRTALECKAPGTALDYADRPTNELLTPSAGAVMGEVLNAAGEDMTK